MDRAKIIISSVASVAATAMVARSMLRDYLPYEIQDYFFSGIRSFFNHFSSQITMVIEEFDGFESNQLYEAIDTYLATIVPADTKRLKARKPEKLKNITVAVERDQEIIDSFEGVKFKWILICKKTESKNFYNPGDINSTLRSEVRSFELCFHKKNRVKVINSYLPSILEKSKSLKQETKALKIFTVNGAQMYGNLHDAWSSVNLDHPGTFDTLAMDSEIKSTIIQDLDRFIERKDFYRKVGKAWKRGYLLYGPPGTGKSSLIAAMANYLKFDIYDLELTELRSNSELRRLLVSTANRSILVVEDIDCTIELQDRLVVEAGPSRPMGFHREQKMTLSGLLNFIDGLWSSCGDERIIMFTTNHKDKLDAALLRPGRMDVHIHMSYCTPCGFRLLVSNYLGIDNHQLLKEIEEMIQTIEVTPAEVAEQLMKSDESQVVLEGLIEFLKVKKKENEEAKAKKLENLEPREIVLGKVVKSDQSAVALEELHEFVKVGKKEKEEAKGKEVEDGTNG